MREYGVQLTNLDAITNANCIIVAVAHNQFKQLSVEDIDRMFTSGPDEEKVLIDVKGLFNIVDLKRKGFTYWRL